MNRLKNIWRSLGPGLLFASMAIGTSHLVLSTKAGAQYGWIMLVPIILANVLKYPFFEFGVRYTNVTRKSLIEGYLQLGKGYLWIYAVVTLISVFTILAALYIVTAGLFVNLLKIEELPLSTVAALLFVFISALLIIGKYRFLENSLKLVISLLFVALIVTTVVVVFKGQVAPIANFEPSPIFDEVGILFLIGLMGWMPTAVEASGWVSLWSIEKQKAQTGTSIKEAMAEFNLGYVLTGILAVFFLIIGCMTLYGTNTQLSGNAAIFADQVVTLFTAHIGDWSYLFIAVAAFATMFSTCITAHDAVSRVSLDVLQKLYPANPTLRKSNVFAIAVLFLALVNWIVIHAFGANMANLVALATFVSFVMAPLIGWMNLKVVMGKDVEKKYRPGQSMRFLTYFGMVFLAVFSIYYCWKVLF